MKLPIASVRSKVPGFLLARYFRKVHGVTAVELHGLETEWGIDITFYGKRFYIDRQLGEVQIFASSDECTPEDIERVRSVADGIPRNIFAAIF